MQKVLVVRRGYNGARHSSPNQLDSESALYASVLRGSPSFHVDPQGSAREDLTPFLKTEKGYTPMDSNAFFTRIPYRMPCVLPLGSKHWFKVVYEFGVDYRRNPKYDDREEVLHQLCHGTIVTGRLCAGDQNQASKGLNWGQTPNQESDLTVRIEAQVGLLAHS